MDIAAAAMSPVVAKLVLLREEHLLHNKRLREDIEFLKELMAFMQDAMSRFNTSEMRRMPSQLEDLLSKILELSYDMEDNLDQFIFCVHGKPSEKALGVGGLIIPMLKNMLPEFKASHKLNKQIQEIKPLLKQFQERYYEWYNEEGQGKQIQAIIISSSTSVPEESEQKEARTSRVAMEVAANPASEADASTLVGMDRPRHQLVSMLQLTGKEKDPESAAALKVVSVCGSGGMGKTTLARVVYDEVRSSFHRSAWVPLCRNPSMANVLMGVLRQVEDTHNREAADGNGERDIITRIRKCLQGKRYLIVLDDIWSTDTWEVIRLALPLDSYGSRVITTTRVYAVARSCSSDWNGYVYQVIPLSSNDAWMLFRSRIIGPPPHLEKIGYKILERCQGVPLAIKTISSLLANNPNWEGVYRNICTPEDPKGMANLILHSYNDLPQPLKMCFLYLSLFPEDYTIPCDHIIRCWIAEGLIPENHEGTAEQVAGSYLNSLKDRSMIEPVCGSHDGRPESFHIHSVILDLIKHISVNHNFVTVLNNAEPAPVLHCKIRRLSIININEDSDIPASMDMSHVRSLHIFGGVGMKLALKHLSFLRVLDLNGCKDLKDHIIVEIHGLTSLRYLRIRDTPTSELPDQTGQERKTNQMSGNCYLNRIPEWFRSLKLLEYVCIDILEVQNKDLQLLSELPLLRHLSLASKTVPKEKLEISRTGFPVLKELHLDSVRKEDLTFDPEAMPKLERLLLPPPHVPINIAQFRCLKKSDIRNNDEGAA